MENYDNVLIVKYGEIALRGKNRHIYERMLMDSIRKNLADLGDFVVSREQGRFVVEGAGLEPDAAIPRIACIFGVVGVAAVLRPDSMDLETLKAAAVACIARDFSPGATFRISASRADKSYPFTSDKIAALVGEYVLEKIPNITVDLRNPDIHVKIEIRNQAYIYSAEVRGPGGLPPGSAGRGVLLLSGGIDSPVAGYLAAKRGIGLSAVYFHAPPYTSERAREKVLDIARQLALAVGEIDLRVVNITNVQLRLAEACPPEKITILLKRAMLKMADKIAAAEGAPALITGDSIGQVASQTLRSLQATNSAAARPIIRPLSCMDKNEITAIAHKIGTYPISIRPYDDCCTLFLPKHPETKPKESIIISIENRIDDLPALMDAAIADSETYKF